MKAAGAHLVDRERRRRRLACAVVAPTGHRAVRLEPAGVLVSCAYVRERTGGGVAWPYVLSPQQATVESALTPHVCRYPALTCVNGPGGGIAWPYVLSPQHWSVPSILSPQASEPPALTSLNVPVGCVRFPPVSVVSWLGP